MAFVDALGLFVDQGRVWVCVRVGALTLGTGFCALFAFICLFNHVKLCMVYYFYSCATIYTVWTMYFTDISIKYYAVSPDQIGRAHFAPAVHPYNQFLFDR